MIATDQQLDMIGYFDMIDSKKSTYIVGTTGVKDLLKKENYYYISGVVAILYPEIEKEIFDIYKIITQYLRHKAGIYVVHILSENIYFSSVGKNFTDLIEGRVVYADTFCS